MKKEEVLKSTEEFVKERLGNEGTGHDFHHVERVRKNSFLIGKIEGDVDMYVVELAALLHDIADHKFHGGDLDVGPRVAREWLESQGVEEDIVDKVCNIVENVSFKGANVEAEMKLKEGQIVHDADRLDALGAIGVARCFAYGGSKGNPIHLPELDPKYHDSFEEYSKERELLSTTFMRSCCYCLKNEH